MSTSTLAYGNLLIERRGAVTVLTVNRPEKLNAIDRTTLGEIAGAVRAFIADPTQGALVVTGAGPKAFIAGADIAELAPLGPAGAEDLSRFGQGVVDLLERSPKPVIAAVNGFALGGGCEIALGCHIRLASDNAVLGLPEVKLGIIPGYGGSQRLPRLVGQGRALELILSGRNVKAEEAERIGLVNRVVPQGQLLEEAVALAETILKNGPVAVENAIESVVRGMSLPLEQGLRFESSRFGMLAATDDMHEGMRAFLEKRPAKFERR
ncbi:MAG: enoyl-CoA hydratase/isomerase family protein [Candidatus Eisenbacteria bacterium]|nr:enoyl-CoA hydratase/isomerase family protein [Candidatus Eisenbacteria bacterium]